MSTIEINENINNRFRNKITIQNIFQKLSLKKEHLNKSFHTLVKEKNDELISIYGNTGIEDKKNLVSFLKEHQFYKRKKKYIQKNMLNTIIDSEIYKDKNNYNNYSNIFESSNSLTNNNYHSLSNSKKKDYETPKHSKFISPLINYNNNSTNYNNRNISYVNKKMKESKSYCNKKVKLVLGNFKRKKLIDIDQLSLTNNSYKNKSIETTPRTNISEVKKKLFVQNNWINKEEIISKKIKKIMKKNTKTEKKLKYILKDGHFFPYINESFNLDLFNIGNKEVIIKRPAKYKIRNFNIEEDMREKLKKYRIEKENYKELNKLKKKNDKIKIEIENKINKELVKSNKLNLKLKFGPKNLDFYKKLANYGKKLMITKINVNK